MKNTPKKGFFNGKHVKYIETENGIFILKEKEHVKLYQCMSNPKHTRFKLEFTDETAKKYEKQEFICHLPSEKIANRVKDLFNDFINLYENKQ
jgi:hypothetical protein